MIQLVSMEKLKTFHKPNNESETTRYSSMFNMLQKLYKNDSQNVLKTIIEANTILNNSSSNNKNFLLDNIERILNDDSIKDKKEEIKIIMESALETVNEISEVISH